MKQLLLLLGTSLLLLATAQAQENKSTTRFEAQHKFSSRWVARHMQQTEANLVAAVDSANSPTLQASAIQTLRELEQIFPQYPFTSALAPLEKKLKDEQADPMVRRLAALALDELHSDAGDAVIQEVSTTTTDKGLQILCTALMVRSNNK
jgi:hypothetical protein